MKSYWDLTEFDRSELTEEGVASYRAYAQMEAGCPVPRKPVLQPQIPIEAEKRKYAVAKFGYSDEIVFDSDVEARAFLALNPKVARGRSSKSQYVEDAGYTLAERFFYSEEDAERVAEDLQENARICEENEREVKRYEREVKAYDAAWRPLMEDWKRCKERRGAFEHMVNTLEEYTALCDGDRAKAIVFLRKTHGTLVDRCLEWHPEWQSTGRLDKIIGRIPFAGELDAEDSVPSEPRAEADTPF